jgi:hypothetical protein
MDAGHGGASGRFEAIKELAEDLVLLDLEKIKSNSKNHFKFGNDYGLINFSSIGYFSLKRNRSRHHFLALIENVPLMKLILSAAYFDIINKSFNIAYYILQNKTQRNLGFVCRYLCS